MIMIRLDFSEKIPLFFGVSFFGNNIHVEGQASY